MRWCTCDRCWTAATAD